MVVSNLKIEPFFFFFFIRSTKYAFDGLVSKLRPFDDKHACFMVKWSDFAGVSVFE